MERHGFVDKAACDTTSILKFVTRRCPLDPLPGVRQNGCKMRRRRAEAFEVQPMLTSTETGMSAVLPEVADDRAQGRFTHNLCGLGAREPTDLPLRLFRPRLPLALHLEGEDPYLA